MDADDLPKVNELCDILFTSCFIDVFPQLKHWLSDYVRHDMFIHVYFTLKLVVKRKGWSCSIALRAAVWTEVFIQWSVVPHHRASKWQLLFEFPEKNYIIWKMRLCFLSKVITYKTVSFQWRFTRKTLLYLCSAHAYQYERPVPNIFDMNTCTVTPLIYIY